MIYKERIYLRPLTTEDVTEKYLSWLNDSETNKFLETRKETMEGLKSYVAERINRKDVFFAGVFDKETNEHIGNIKLEPIDWIKKRAVFGILIGNKNFRGKGIGTEATKLTVKIAFEIFELDKVELGVISDNIAATKAYEKAGFKVREVKKGAINHEGVLYDEIIMIVRKQDF